MCNIVPDLTCVIMKVIVMGSQLGLLGHLGQDIVSLFSLKKTHIYIWASCIVKEQKNNINLVSLIPSLPPPDPIC